MLMMCYNYEIRNPNLVLHAAEPKTNFLDDITYRPRLLKYFIIDISDLQMVYLL